MDGTIPWARILDYIKGESKLDKTSLLLILPPLCLPGHDDLGATTDPPSLPQAALDLRCCGAAVRNVTKTERGVYCDSNYTQVQSGRKTPETKKQKATVIITKVMRL